MTNFTVTEAIIHTLIDHGKLLIPKITLRQIRDCRCLFYVISFSFIEASVILFTRFNVIQSQKNGKELAEYTVLSREVIRDSMSENLTFPDNSFVVVAAASERDFSVPLTCRGRE